MFVWSVYLSKNRWAFRNYFQGFTSQSLSILIFFVRCLMEEKNQGPKTNVSGVEDNLHTLSLTAFDIKHKDLYEARLIKNVFLETVIEFIDEELAADGPMQIRELALKFDESDVSRDEIKMISSIAALPSFDCYTLKRGMAPLKIKVKDDAIFKLSNNRKASLFDLMSRLTRPLIQYLYTDDNLRIKDTSSLLELIQNTEPLKVRDRLGSVARNLEVSLIGLPNFLQEFSELFLSVSYFESIFREYNPKLDQFLLWAEDGVMNSNLRNDPNAQREFSNVDKRFKQLKGNLDSRFRLLSNITQVDWDDLNSSEFKKIQREILSQQANLAIGLCGLSVKMIEWEKQFPSAGGSPQQCLEFLSNEASGGLDNLLRSLPSHDAQ